MLCRKSKIKSIIKLKIKLKNKIKLKFKLKNKTKLKGETTMLYKISILGDAFDANYFKEKIARILFGQSRSGKTANALVSCCKKG